LLACHDDAQIRQPSSCSQLLEIPMSRTAAIVLSLSIGLPVIAFIAAAGAAGTSQSLITGGLSFFVVVTAVIAMLFEIKRLADGPGTADPHA
jgi:hypothetical protein